MCLPEHTTYTIFTFQSYYKQPRLRKGAIPSQFLWTETTTLDNAPLHEPTQNPVHEIIQQCGEENVQEGTSNEPNELEFSFRELITYTTLQVPINWTRRTLICEGTKIESFVTVQGLKIENSFVTRNIKELIVQDNLNLKVNVIYKLFDITNLGISNVINSIGEVEAALNILDARQICCGVSAAKNVICDSSVAYIDSIETVRHKQCLILLESKGQCTICKRLENN